MSKFALLVLMFAILGTGYAESEDHLVIHKQEQKSEKNQGQLQSLKKDGEAISSQVQMQEGGGSESQSAAQKSVVMKDNNGDLTMLSSIMSKNSSPAPREES